MLNYFSYKMREATATVLKGEVQEHRMQDNSSDKKTNQRSNIGMTIAAKNAATSIMPLG